MNNSASFWNQQHAYYRTMQEARFTYGREATLVENNSHFLPYPHLFEFARCLRLLSNISYDM